MDPQQYGATMRIVPPTIPPDAVVFLGGAASQYVKWILERNKKRFVIAWPNPDGCKPILADNFTKEMLEAGEEKTKHILPIIQSLLPTFDFDGPSNAYLHYSPKVGYKIIQKFERLPKVACATWLPLVSIEEIELNRFFGADPHRRGGKYRGQQVDLWIAYDRRSMRWLGNMMQRYLMLSELDLTYKAVGHLVNDEGAVIGFITEPANGRQIEYRDKPLLYDAIARLHQRNLVVTEVSPIVVHIQRGKVRFADLLGIHHYPRQEDLERKSQRGQFVDLAKFFSTPPDPFHRPTKPRVGLPYMTHDAAWLLPMPPSPGISLSIPVFLEKVPQERNLPYDRNPKKNKALGLITSSPNPKSDAVSLVKRTQHWNHAKLSSTPYPVRARAPPSKHLSPETVWGDVTDDDLRTLDGSDSATLCSAN